MRFTFAFILLCSTALNGISQSIKYDDLYTLLSSGQYKLATPFLKYYLKENTNNANAYYYMGRVYEDQLSTSYSQVEIQRSLDSAVYYYKRSIGLLTQKEIEKNKQYYKPFRRRDLKTGKEVIKLSDIQSDIELRIRNLNAINQAIALPLVSGRMTNQNQPQTDSTPPKPEQISKSDGLYYAIIIGISTYDSSNLNLDRPMQDALALQEVITKKYEFEPSNVFTLMNPTRQQIIFTLYNFRKKIRPVDNLLIFYAGHGYWDAEANQGYWWPRDASPQNPTNWLSNSDIREQIRGIKSNHTLLISDACFSGGILKVRGASAIKEAPLDIVSVYKIPSRRAITSGTMTEVPDRSVFFDYLVKRLQQNEERYVTSQSLFDSFKKAVINNSLIVPQDGVIADTGDEGGDFVFIKRQ
jgi:hypothetical protein